MIRVNGRDSRRQPLPEAWGFWTATSGAPGSVCWSAGNQRLQLEAVVPVGSRLVLNDGSCRRRQTCFRAPVLEGAKTLLRPAWGHALRAMMRRLPPKGGCLPIDLQPLERPSGTSLRIMITMLQKRRR